MKLLGLLGGMSWESTLDYYRLLNQGIRALKGGLHSARILLYSVDFAEIARAQHEGDWDKTAEILCAAAISLERAGAEGILLCTNTMHKVAPAVEKAISIPLIHIADAVATQVKKAHQSKIGLLATQFTMEDTFYRERLLDLHNLSVTTPPAAMRHRVHEIIYTELCKGIFSESSREELVTIIEALQDDGAQGVILGCTELELLVTGDDTAVPLFLSTRLHVEAGLEWALS